jgi:lysophospholipase L1-like esterase
MDNLLLSGSSLLTGASSASNTLTLAQKAAIAAAKNNLFANPVASSVTINAPSSSPSTTGFTNIVPAANGFAESFTGTTIPGSNTITNVSSTSGLVIGMPVCEQNTTPNYPTRIPLGAYITAINTTTSVVTISQNALGAGTAFTILAYTDKISIIGGEVSNNNGNMFAFGATIGNYTAPPTASELSGSPYALEFITDAANFTTSTNAILFKIYANSNSPVLFRIAIDDVYQTSAPVAFGTTTGGWVEIQFSTAGAHKVRLELPAGFLTQQIWITTGSSVWKPKSSCAVKALFFGDSFFQGGASQSWPGRNLAHTVANMLGWRPYLSGVGGTGYAANGGINWNWANTNRLADFSYRSYDAVVILGSINDGGQSTATVQSNALTVFQAARAAQPNATIFVFGVPTTVFFSQTSAMSYENAVAAAFAQWGDSNAYFIPISTDPDGDWITTANEAFSGGSYVDYASFTGTTSGTTLTVSAMTSGFLRVGQTIMSGAGIMGSPTIVAQLTGTTGQTGTYQLSVSQTTISAEAMTAGDGSHPSDSMGVLYYANKIVQKIFALLTP